MCAYFLAPSVADVQAAIEHIFPLVYEFRKERTKEEKEALARKKQKQFGDVTVMEQECEEFEEEPDDAIAEQDTTWD